MGVIARQSIKGALANYLGVAIGFVTTFFVVTRMLSQEEVGLTRMMVDGAVLFSTVAALGTSSSVVKFFPHFRTTDRHHHGAFGLSLLVPAIGFILTSAIFLIFRQPLTASFEAKSPLLSTYIHLIPMLACFMLYMTVFETNASVLMRISIPKMVREVGVRLLNLGAYLLYGYGAIGIDAFVWMFCGSYGAAMLLDGIYLLKLTGFDWRAFRIERGYITKQLMGEMVRYTLLMTATVLAASMPMIASLFLGAKVGAATAGVYAIASYIANVVEVPYRSLGAISRPVIAAAVKDDNWTEVNRLGKQVSLHQMMVSLIILYIIWINLGALFSIIPEGESYRSGTMVVLILGLAKVANSSLSVATDVLGYSRHYAYGLLFTSIMTIGMIVLTECMISLWGIIGSAAAVLTVYIAYYTPLLWLLRRKTGFSPFSTAQVRMLAIVAVGFALNWIWERSPQVDHSIVWTIGMVAIKTIVLTGALVAATLRRKVSPTVNAMVGQAIAKVRGKKGEQDN